MADDLLVEEAVVEEALVVVVVEEALLEEVAEEVLVVEALVEDVEEEEVVGGIKGFRVHTFMTLITMIHK